MIKVPFFNWPFILLCQGTDSHEALEFIHMENVPLSVHPALTSCATSICKVKCNLLENSIKQAHSFLSHLEIATQEFNSSCFKLCGERGVALQLEPIRIQNPAWPEGRMFIASGELEDALHAFQSLTHRHQEESRKEGRTALYTMRGPLFFVMAALGVVADPGRWARCVMGDV